MEVSNWKRRWNKTRWKGFKSWLTTFEKLSIWWAQNMLLEYFGSPLLNLSRFATDFVNLCYRKFILFCWNFQDLDLWSVFFFRFYHVVQRLNLNLCNKLYHLCYMASNVGLVKFVTTWGHYWCFPLWEHVLPILRCRHFWVLSYLHWHLFVAPWLMD